MQDTPRKPLSEAFAGLIAMIIAMIPGLLRARGLRGLLELPTHLRLALELRRMAEEFVALFAAFQAGTLPPLPPATTPAERQDTHAQSADPARPAKATRPYRARQPRARRVATVPATPLRLIRARHQPYPRPIRAPAPPALAALRPHPREADRRP